MRLFKHLLKRLIYSILYHTLVICYCCDAIMAEREACKSGVSVEEYCQKHPKTQECKGGRSLILKVAIVVDQ